MYISEVAISNYRNFNDFKGALNENLSIIIGENNVGKSNFLDAIQLIFNRDFSMRKRVLDQEDFWNGIIIKDTWPEIVIEVTLKDIASEAELAVTSRWLTSVAGEARLTYRYRPKANISVTAPNEATPINKLKLPLAEYEWVIYGGEIETLDNFDFHMLNKFGIEYVGALRDATLELKKTSGHLQKIFKSLDLDEEALRRITLKIDDLNEEILEGQDIKSVQEDINLYLAEISGTSSQNIKIQMGESNYDSLLKDLKVVIGEDEGKMHSVGINGLGFNNLLYISLLLTQHITLKKKITASHDYFFPILIVEEPEAHLHSHLQKHLASYFFKENMAGQVIMTSHSSNISSHSDLDSLIMFYRTTNQVQSRQIGRIFNLEDKEETQYKRYLERWLDATKSDIFFSRKVILVEGIAERLLFPKFFSIINSEKTMESEGVAIISVDGVAFRPFLHLFSSLGIDIKCVAVTDSDPEAIPLEDGEGNEILDKNDKVLKEEVYPSKRGEFNPSARTVGLINDFVSLSNIDISYNIKTFEYDLILNENHVFFWKLICKHKLGTKNKRQELRLLKGVEFAREAFQIISKQKGELSQIILDELNEGETLNIPSYITEAFEFLEQEEGGSMDER